MKVTRDAFLYLPPKPPAPRFAQCSTCRDWVSGDRRCVIHGAQVTVPGTASCGFYVHGTPHAPGAKTSASVTPEQSGLVDRQVRCENCRYMDEDVDKCGFYRMLNEKMPDVFDLKVDVHPQACCNAQTP